MRKVTSGRPLTAIKDATTYVLPSNGALGVGDTVLAANTTYYFVCGGQDASIVHIGMQFDAAIVITTATVQDTSFAEDLATDYEAVGGAWQSESPSDAYVAKSGAGTTLAAGVITTNGSAAGGATWHIVGTGARRTRLEVKVGATGGHVRVVSWGKES